MILIRTSAKMASRSSSKVEHNIFTLLQVASLANPYLYEFFKQDAMYEPSYVKDDKKDFGFNIDQSKKSKGVMGWLGKKYRQFSQFFGRRQLADLSDSEGEAL